MNFSSQIFFSNINNGYEAAILKKSSLWLLPFYMVVTTYCYFKKVRRTRRSAIVLYLLNLTKRKKTIDIEEARTKDDIPVKINRYIWMRDFFLIIRLPYNILHKSIFARRNLKTVLDGTPTL